MRIERAFLACAALTVLAAAAPPVVNVPLPSHGNTIRLVVTGDAGSSSSRLTKAILVVQKEKPIDAIVLVGDNFYPCGVSSVTDPQWSKVTKHFGWAKVPIFAVLGNHDYGDPGREGTPAPPCANANAQPGAQVSATGTVPLWQFPARSYVLQNRIATLAMLDTEPIALGWTRSMYDANTSAELQQWLRGRLDAAQTKWRIVVGHHTFYSSGDHGRRNGFDQQQMRTLLPLLRAEHVDLYMGGHDHDMELVGDLAAKDSPLFLISGAGSGLGEMKPRADSLREPATIWPSPVKPITGFALVEISERELAITFYDAAGKAISDRFVRTK